jgi:hypothetical protein
MSTNWNSEHEEGPVAEGKPQKGAGRAEMINVAGKYFSFLFSCN